MNENNNVVNNQVPVQGTAVQPGVPVQPGVANQPTAQPSGAHGTSGATGAAIVCDKCGTSYSSSQRYCMKCGNLNYSHPSNQSMKQYLNYDVINQNYINNGNAKLTHTSVDPYSKEKNVSLIVNIILHSIIPILLLVLMIKSGSVSMLVLLLCILVFGFLFLTNAGMCGIFIKAKEPWWFYYIPILNCVILAKIMLGSALAVFLFLIPGINIIAILVGYYKLGSRFGYNGLLTMLFPIIMIPVIGFGNREETVGSLQGAQISLGDDEFDKKGRTRSEAEYGKKKGATIFGIVLVLGILVVLLFPYIKDYGGSLLDFLVEKYHEFIEIIKELN